MAVAIGFQDKLARDLRVVGMGCCLVAGACVFIVCGWKALQAARARAIVTLDGDTLTVREFGLRGGRTDLWRRSDLQSLAAGYNVVSVQPLFPFRQRAAASASCGSTSPQEARCPCSVRAGWETSCSGWPPP